MEFLKDGEEATENTPLKPISLYAKHKVLIEDYIINTISKKSLSYSLVILRFATAFGFSERMRFDLTINEFTRELYNKKILKIYDEFTWRPYCHILDFADIIIKLSNSELNSLDIFNAGSNKNNFRKIDIFNAISKYIKNSRAIFENGGNDFRNYKVNFNKLSKVINKKYKSIDYGVKEIINALDKNKELRFAELGNYTINKKFH